MAALAAELDAAYRQIETLAVALISDPQVAAAHGINLQSLDHVGQRCAVVAAILRADDQRSAALAAPLESIAARLSPR